MRRTVLVLAVGALVVVMLAGYSGPALAVDDVAENVNENAPEAEELAGFQHRNACNQLERNGVMDNSLGTFAPLLPTCLVILPNIPEGVTDFNPGPNP